MADGELSLIDKGISSLLEVPLKPTVTSLNLHCNRLRKIEGLTTAWHVRHLDLSSNHITHIEGLGALSSLRTLNLSCNSITKLEGLKGLVNLRRLNVSYNEINNLTGLLYLHGTEYKLEHLQLHRNRLDNINHVLQCMVGLRNLREITFTMDGADNPICHLPGYRNVVLQSLQQICTLDGEDRLGKPTPPGNESPMDIPGLEDFLEFLISSDSSVNVELVQTDTSLPTPRIDEVLMQFRHCNRVLNSPPETLVRDCSVRGGSATGNQINKLRIKKLEQQVSQLFQKTPMAEGHNALQALQSEAKRETDVTSESEYDGAKENLQHSRVRRPKITAVKKLVKGKPLDNESSTPKSRSFKLTTGSGHTTAVQTLGVREKAKKSLRACQAIPDKDSKHASEETYTVILQERDQERERRWKAEQAVIKLTEQVKGLQTRATEEKELHSLALHTTERLKETLLKERSERTTLQARVEELEERCTNAAHQLEQRCSHETQYKDALYSLQESISQQDVLRARQQVEEMKRKQELENKCSVLKREVEILRTSVQQHKDKLQHLQELLTSREEAYRKELASRLIPGGAEFCEAVASYVETMEQRHIQKHSVLEQKLADAQQQYTTLEDEFRMALIIEAKRFSEVKEAFEQVSAELAGVKIALNESQQKEKQSGSLAQELSAMVKEQKTRIADLIKAKHDAVTELKTLQTGALEDRRLGLQLELLKKDKVKLLSQLTAQVTVIEGLRAERRLWGQELAHQGASLAQDRGRMEAKIEALTTELETQKKQNQRDNDSLKIKTKIVDDQTETIQKLKESVQGRDEQLRALREENLQAQRTFQKKLETEMASEAELRDAVDRLSLRKDELKQQLLDKEAEMDELKNTYSAASRKWQDKTDLLSKLECQVKRMKEGFDAKEKALLEERDKTAQAHKAVVEKLHCVDNAFRQQLESLQASHQAELLQLANDKQKELEQANRMVFQVEDEMRYLLEETESKKNAMEEKMRRLTSVLKDF